jgi:hypothetical protein
MGGANATAKKRCRSQLGSGRRRRCGCSLQASRDIDRIVILAYTFGRYPEKLQRRKLFNVARDDQGPSGLRLAEISESYAKAPQPEKLIVHIHVNDLARHGLTSKIGHRSRAAAV